MLGRSTTIRLATCVAGSWLCVAPVASAQTPEDLTTAREHFKSARRLEQQKDWAGAAAKLRAALRVKETPGLRYHLAYCEEQLASYAAALLDYQRAERLLAEGQKAADVSRLLGPALERVSALVAEVTVIPPDDAEYSVFLDGNKIPTKEPLKVDPGLHRVRAVRGGREQRHEFVAAARGEYRIELTPPPAPKPAPPKSAPPAKPADAAPAPQPQASIRVPVLIGEAAITALSLGVGAGFTLRANQASSEADRALADIRDRAPEAQCASLAPDVQSACAQLEDFKRLESAARKTATFGFVGAGVGALLFVGTWLLWPERTPTSAHNARARFIAGSDGRRSFVGLTGQF